MNRLIKAIILISLSPLYIFSQLAWTDITYHFQTGTVPPPYYYSYELHINSGGECNLTYRPTYSNDSIWVYKFNLISDQINELDSIVIKSGVLTDSINSLPENKHPIGGSIKNIIITLYQDPTFDRMPPVIKTPYFPTAEFKEKLENLYDSAGALIPQNIWDEIKERKEKAKN
jgi:hypothetical protein